MCRAKSDERNPGGRRCPAHARERITNINEQLGSINSELEAGREAYKKTMNSHVQGVINARLKELAEERAILLRERKYNQDIADHSIVGIVAIREQAKNTVDADKKAELEQRANKIEKELEAKKKARQQAYEKQGALMLALENAGVPAHERVALLESIHSDTGSSNLRSWKSYDDKLKTAKEQLKQLNAEATRLSNKVWTNSNLTDTEKLKQVTAIEKQYKKIQDKEKLIKELEWNKYQTLDGLIGFDDDSEEHAEEQELLINEAIDRNDYAKANKLRLELTHYQGSREGYRKVIEETRAVRLSDRALRDGLKGRIKRVLKEQGASKEQIQTALNAYAHPDAYEAWKNRNVVNGWEQRKSVVFYLTQDEAESMGGFDQDSLVKTATKKPELPKGQTLNEVHSSFKRHSVGHSGRHTTVPGVKRLVAANFAMKTSELAVVDGHAHALGVTRSAYLRGMIVTKQPFALLNDRSKTTRSVMRAKAKKFIGRTKEETKAKLESVGGNYWAKGNQERIYFDAKQSYALAGGNISYYNNSGRPSSASIPGLERISNSKAHVKAYYDLKTEKLVVTECGDDRVKEAVEAGFKKFLD